MLQGVIESPVRYNEMTYEWESVNPDGTWGPYKPYPVLEHKNRIPELEIECLQRRIKELEDENADLKATIEELEEKLSYEWTMRHRYQDYYYNDY